MSTDLGQNNCEFIIEEESDELTESDLMQRSFHS